MDKPKHYDPNKDFIHHRSPAYLYSREIVFGAQDGMVSVIGALTGIAVGTNNLFVVFLSGIAMISIGAISMAIGTFTSSGTEKKMQKRMLHRVPDLSIPQRPTQYGMVECYLRGGTLTSYHF